MSLVDELKQHETMNKIQEILQRGEKIPNAMRDQIKISWGRPAGSFHSAVHHHLQSLPTHKTICPVCEGAGEVHALDLGEEQEMRTAWRDALLLVIKMKPEGVHLCNVDGELFVVGEMEENTLADPSMFDCSLGRVIEFSLNGIHAQEEYAPTQDKEKIEQQEEGAGTEEAEATEATEATEAKESQDADPE